MLLLFVVVIPFATATMAEYLTLGGQDSHIAMALYAGVFEGMSLAFCGIFAWMLGEGRTHHPVPPEALVGAWIRFGLGLLFYLVAFAVGFISAPAALAIIGLVAIYYMIGPTSAAARRRFGGAA